MVNVDQLLEGFHADRPRWAAYNGMDDVPAVVPVLCSQETIDLLDGGDLVSGQSPYNSEDNTLFWHPVIIREDFEVGEFRFSPRFETFGTIAFFGGPFQNVMLKTLTRFPSEVSMMDGKWRHIFHLQVDESAGGAIYLRYQYQNTVVGCEGVDLVPIE